MSEAHSDGGVNPAAPTVVDAASPTTSPVAMEVALSVTAGGRLHLDYTVTNGSGSPILLWDQIVTTKDGKLIALPDAVSTLPDAQADTVRFVRGHVLPHSRVNYEYVPGVRPLDAGATLTGSAEVDLPLKSWLAYGEVRPLPGTPTQAVFELQYFPGDHATTPMALADGSTLPKPAQPWSAAVTLRSAPLPIPTR